MRFKDDDIRDALLAILCLIIFEAVVWSAVPAPAAELASATDTWKW